LRIVRVLAPNPGPFTLEGTNTWIVGAGRALVIDPGPLDAGHIEAIRREAGEIAAILLTHHHPDHAPAAATLSALTGAAVFAFRPEAEESKISEGDVIDGLQAVHTPGHTEDHLAFFDPSSSALFTGDAVLGRGTSVIDPPEGDMATYAMSLRRMLGLRPALIYPGHGPTVASAEAKLREYIEHREQRERQVLEGLSEGPQTPEDLVRLIYEAYPAHLHQAAARSVLAHLIKLEREGRVVRLPTTAGDRFELTAASG
jgi:glyoxylase-like metal-dependent hydrolase (beta-lactamase superfamily II)